MNDLTDNPTSKSTAAPPDGRENYSVEPMQRNPPEIEAVRGRLDEPRADEVLAFWAARNALPADEAQRRLPEVVCVLRLGGSVAGVSSAHPAEVGLIGARRFWVYRNLLAGEAAQQMPAMITATFNALASEFDGSRGSPIGLCVLLDEQERRRRPEVEWSDPRMIYAGYLADGRQVRIAYFDGAVITREQAYA